MAAGSRLVGYLGLTGGDPRKDGRIPKWEGSAPGSAWRWVVVWALVALGVFRLLSARVPEDDGFGGFIPVWFALLVWLLGVNLTERALLRSKHDE